MTYANLRHSLRHLRQTLRQNANEVHGDIRRYGGYKTQLMSRKERFRANFKKKNDHVLDIPTMKTLEQ